MTTEVQDKSPFNVFDSNYLNVINHAYYLANGVNEVFCGILKDKYTPPTLYIESHTNNIPCVEEYNSIAKTAFTIKSNVIPATHSQCIKLAIQITLEFNISKTRIVYVYIQKNVVGDLLITFKVKAVNHARYNSTFTMGECNNQPIAVGNIQDLAKNETLLKFIEDSFTPTYINVCASISCPAYNVDTGCEVYNITNGAKCHLMTYANQNSLLTHVNDGANSFCIDQDLNVTLPELEEINNIALLWKLIDIAKLD